MEMGNSMTADEIRKLGLQAEKDLRLVPPSGWQILFLAEIAAQLAEMNEMRPSGIQVADAELLAAGTEMCEHYRDLVTSLFAEDSPYLPKEVPPSITRWEKLTRKFPR
jgi:hypothetical protein